MSDNAMRSVLEDRLRQYAGKNGRVIVRTAAELAYALARNPSADSPDNCVMALFVDDALPVDPLDGVTGIKSEQVRLGK